MIAPAPLERLVPGEGEMARRIRAHDWPATPLGAAESWPVALTNALSLLLPAAAEICLFWGDEHVALYNDAYAPTLGHKHPRALGRPARECWAELWDDLAPLLDHVRATGETFSAKDRAFHMERAGYNEELFFDVSYSAVRVEDGSVGGVLCIVSETTERVRAARAVAADRARLRELFDAAPGFAAVLRVPGYRFEFANAAFQAIVGERAVTGRSFLDALPELAGEGAIERFDAVVATREPYTATGLALPVRGPDGMLAERLIDVLCQPIADAAGAVTSIFIQGTDVTDRAAAERALLLSRESLALAVEAAEIGTWDYDPLAETLHWDERTRQHFFLGPDEPLDLDLFFRRLHPDDRASVEEAFAAALDPARRALFDTVYRVIAPDGAGERWIAARGRGLFDEADATRRAIGTSIDITERFRESEALRESEERFRTLADSLPALVWLSDAAGKLVFANDGFRHILGVAPERIVAEGWKAVVPPADRAAMHARFADRLSRPRDQAGDFRVVTGTGEERWVHGEARPRFVAGTFVGYVGCAIDVTAAHLAGERLEARVAERTAELTRQIAERERVEQTLHQMQRLEAIGQLTSGVAHDFNNLLTVVLGNVDMLARAGERDGLAPRALHRLEHVRQAAERGAKLTAQLLAFSRRQRLEARAIDLNAVVGGMTELLGSTLGRTIAIDTVLAPDPWPALVDPTQIELIILNLAINARDAMAGGGRLSLRTANVARGEPERPEEPPAGDYVAVSVSDDGTGMAPDTLARAFEPFFTTKEVGKGSGLGLAQVFGFAKQSGGGVRIDSAVGVGTTVSVFLPRADGYSVAPTLDAVHAADASAARGRVVLVLDDEDAVREVTAETLREAGYRVIEAADGAAALEAVAEEPTIGAVVADVMMPHMTGIEFARRVAALQRDLPVLFVTGYADVAEVDGLPDARLLRKPYDRGMLAERVGALFAGG